ncbi:MAG: hypothetical protein II336_08480 [Loktanella sp.]|nr:hypothetical protein [Loktanella sp.]
MITTADLQGHWRRDWITAPGFEDATTHVHWMQAGDLFADLRVPADLPALTGTCLADLDEAALQSLLRIEGFAGQITVTDSQCTWHREINWQGALARPDVGAMSFDGPVLIEDGVHAEYREAWLAQATAPLRAHRIAWGDMTGVLIASEDRFLFGIGPAPQDRPVPEIFISHYALGHWDGATGIADLSSNPFACGQPVITRDTGFIWHAPLFTGGSDPRPLKVQ